MDRRYTSKPYLMTQPVSQPRSRPRRRRFKKLPPGQRLICYFILASFLTLTQPLSLPADTSDTDPLVPVAETEVQPPFQLTAEFSLLNQGIKQEANKPNLHTGVFVVEPKSGRYIDLDGHRTYQAASLIKIPVLVALLMAIDKKLVQPDQKIFIRPALIAGGSGYLQWRVPYSKLSVKEATEMMIKISDNTATNLIIDLLGGTAKVNKQLLAMGLTQTRIVSWLPDLEGTNKTSPYELAYLLGRIDKGELISPTSRNWMFDMMQHVKTNSLLPVGLASGAQIAHKTGDIGSMVGDAGIVLAPNGTRYLVAVQVERPHNDHRANLLVRYISRLIYEGFVNGNTENVSFADIDPKPAPLICHHKRMHHHYVIARAHVSTHMQYVHYHKVQHHNVRTRVV